MRRPIVDHPEDPAACYEVALRSLERRWHAERELAGKLLQKGFEKSAVAGAMDRLRAEGWINDARFASAYAHDRARRRIGPERIRAELMASGVAGEIASEASRTAFEEGDQEAALETACRRKGEALRRRHGEAYLDSDEGRNKLMGYLLKQGYDYAAVLAAVRGFIRS